MRKAWYDPNAPIVPTATEVRVAREVRSERRRRVRGTGLGACLVYPLTDGPGVALLVVMPPILFLLSLPVFDWIAIVDPFRRANWALGLLALPIFLPLLTTFLLVMGYSLLVVGQMLVASAMGEYDQPSWPEWNSATISEGLGRWLWAAVFGVAIGGFPIVAYWIYCGNIDWFDRMVFAELAILGAGYAQMALAAALLHESLVAANPITVVAAIGRIGWDYVQPALVGGIAIMLGGGLLWLVLFGMPSLHLAALALWGFWVYALYAGMVVLRVLGLTYFAHSDALVWFRDRPRWTVSSRAGRLYTNS
jgi:hypothetical protein